MIWRNWNAIVLWVFSYFLKSRCPAGKEKIGVTCYGDVIGCSYNPLCFGNIFEEPLQKVWERMGRFSQFAKDFEGCLSCEDSHYVDYYVRPVYDAAAYPVSFRDHPKINIEEEPMLFAE